MISSTPIVPTLVLSVIPSLAATTSHGICIQLDTYVLAPFCASSRLVYNDERSAWAELSVRRPARPTVAPTIFTYSKTVEPGMIARPIHPEV